VPNSAGSYVGNTPSHASYNERSLDVFKSKDNIPSVLASYICVSGNAKRDYSQVGSKDEYRGVPEYEQARRYGCRATPIDHATALF
jgi:hypothetical protein